MMTIRPAEALALVHLGPSERIRRQMELKAARKRDATEARAAARLMARIRGREPIEWQEEQHPTEAVRVLISFGGGGVERRERITCRRRKSDARLWDAFEAEDEWAADLIVRGWLLASDGRTVRAQTYSDVGRRPSSSTGIGLDIEADILAVKRFRRWLKDADRQGLAPMDAVSIIVENESCAAVDRRRRQRHGTARDRLMDALALYVAIAARKAR